MRAIETLTFQLRPEISESSFLEAVPASDAFLRRQPGFVARRLGKTGAIGWLDLVEWADMESARAAALAFMREPSLARFIGSIDGATVAMEHFEIVVAS